MLQEKSRRRQAKKRVEEKQYQRRRRRSVFAGSVVGEAVLTREVTVSGAALILGILFSSEGRLGPCSMTSGRSRPVLSDVGGSGSFDGDGGAVGLVGDAVDAGVETADADDAVVVADVAVVKDEVVAWSVVADFVGFGVGLAGDAVGG